MGRTRVGMTSVAENALAVLGNEVRLARAGKKMTIAELAARAGVSPRTVSAIEAGAPATAVGNVFTVAAAVGFPLFYVEDPNEFAALRLRGEEKIALMPKRVDHPRLKDDDGNFDF